jgi:DNA ligase-1
MTMPMLASDYDESKLKFPLLAQPKIDGVRGVHLTGAFTGRSLKAHKNKAATALFSHPAFEGLDGELTVGDLTGTDLCRDTTSRMGTIKGESDGIIWNVFDLINEETAGLTYSHRYAALGRRLREIEEKHHDLSCLLSLVPSFFVTNLDQLLELDDKWLDEGYEGTIIRDPLGAYKQGRSTVKEGGLLRIKRFMQEDAEVLEVVEGQSNGNEAKTNELGRTERSSHQENMTPNGMVGTLTCRVLRDVLDLRRPDSILLRKGQIITVSAGKMKQDMRLELMANPDKIVGKTISFKFFPKGMLDKPRFPTFHSIRLESDNASE